LQHENRVSPNLETAKRGIYGFTQLLGFATWTLTFLTFFLTDVSSNYIGLWLTIGFIIWASARKLPNQSLANLIQFISLTLILGTPLIFDTADADRWIPITVIALALVAILAFQIESWLVIPAVFGFVLIIKILIDMELTSYLYGGALYKSGLMSILYLITVSLTTWVMKKITLNQAQAFDQAIAKHAEELEQVRKDQIDREINQSIARRLHESVLNTFTAIAKLTDTNLLVEIKKVVKRDLESLEQISNQIRPVSLDNLIEEALFRTTINREIIKITSGGEVEVTVATYSALLESITEALRNIERHSGADRIEISWKITDKVLLQISDNGVGFESPKNGTESFGLRVIKHQALLQAGHVVEIESDIGKGTTFRWHLKEFNPKSNSIKQSETWPKLTEDNQAFRFLFLIVPMFIAISIHMLSTEFADQASVIFGFFAYVSVLAIYAAIKQSKLRFVALPFLLGIIFWGQLNLINQTTNCIDALPMQWIINGYTIGILLILMSNIPILIKFVILSANTFVLLLVSTSLAKCQEIALLPGLTGIVVSVGLIFGLGRLRKANMESMMKFEDSLEGVLELKHRQDATDRAHLRLNVVTQDAKEILKKILHSKDDSEYAKLRQSCLMQEAYLRSALLIIQTMRVETQQNLLDILSQLAKNNVRVSIESWTENLGYIIWPDPVIEFGYLFGQTFKNGDCKLMFFENDNQILFVLEANGDTDPSYQKYDFVEILTADHIRVSEVIGIISDTSRQTEISPQQSFVQQ
jgi:signal transduction histidine kinase